MADYESQSWMTNIPLYSFLQWLGGLSDW
jgi:hypothetical protein